MDEQISRNIMENFEVPTVENPQHEIHKLNAPGVLKAIENGSLQFITVPTRDSEFIDHSLLNPEYITTHLANGGFIIDLMENHDTNQDHNQSTQYISESIGNELQFQHSNDDSDRRLTATLFQLVKGNVRVGNETQVIVTNKDGELDTQQLLTIDDHQETLTHSLLNEGQFKIFPSSAISLTGGSNQLQLNNQPLPHLTPIRRLSRQRKNSINNSSNNVLETVNMTVQNLKTTTDELLDQNRYQRPLAKKVLPHKKRITKKLKAIDKIESEINIQQPPLIQQNDQQQTLQHQQIEYYGNTEVIRQDESINLNTSSSKFACQICGLGFETQLEFFSHLKEHYEPPIKTDENDENNETKFIVKEQAIDIISKEEPTFSNVSLPSVELRFHNFDNTDVVLDQQQQDQNSTQFHENHQFNNHHQTNQLHSNQQSQDSQQFHSKLDDLPTQVLNLENKTINMPQTIISASNTITTHNNQIQNLTTTGTTNQSSATNKGLVIIQDELEFSDTEDMLEGIRGVVDKVQESVDDTGDEMDMMSPSRLGWYSNSALNGEINFKQPRIQNINTNVDSYQIFFKNDLNQQKQENDNCQNDDDDRIVQHAIENRIIQHAFQLQHHPQEQQQQESPNNLIHAVIVEHNRQHQETMTSASLSNIQMTDNNSNSVMTTLHIPYPNDFNTTIKSEDLSSIDDNTSEYSPNLVMSKMKKHKKPKNKYKKQKKSKSIENSNINNIKDSKSKSPIDNGDCYGIGTTEPKRSRGRPLKSQKIIGNNINENDEITKIDDIILQEMPPEIDHEIYSDNYGDDDINDDLDNDDDDDGIMKKFRKKYICQKCYKVFNSINALKYHDFSHTGVRPHQCDICGKSFFAVNALRAHLRVHSGEKPFNCDECGRAFRQWGDLTYHKISIHSNEKNFQCEFCGKAFARKYSLVIHRRIHTQERNYKCEFCPKTFRASSYLQNHRKIHTGEKPYICGTCNKKFRVCGDLKRHQKIHEREKKLTTHLEEIIKTERNPIKEEEELIIPDKLIENLATTYYCTKQETDLINIKTETTNSDNNNDTTRPTTITNLLATATTKRTPKINKKNHKTNSKKKSEKLKIIK